MWRAAIASRRVRSYATIDGIAVARGIREALRADIEQVKRSTPTFAPRLAIIQVGEARARSAMWPVASLIAPIPQRAGDELFSACSLAPHARR